MPEISGQLDALCVGLIDEALWMLDAGEDVVVLLATDAQDDALGFEDDTPDGCYRAACEHIAGLGAACTRYALLYAGAVQHSAGESARDALLFEFAERGMPHAWSGYVLCGRDDDGRVWAGEACPAGACELLFGT